MKNIFTTISAIFFLAGSICLNLYLNSGNDHQVVMAKDHKISPVVGHFCQQHTGALPVDLCNCEKPAEGRHVGNSQSLSVRKALSRDLTDARLVATVHTIAASNNNITSPKLRLVALSADRNSVPLHLRNCVWLI